MGGIICRINNNDNQNPKCLVLQTGKLRDYSDKNDGDVKSLNLNDIEGTIHRFLPSHLESKYEAYDFASKFGLHNNKYINLVDAVGGNGSYIGIAMSNRYQGEQRDLEPLVKNVNIIVSCGSTSLQAFKLTQYGTQPLLPVTDEIKKNKNVFGDKMDPNLSYESMNSFGGSSDDVNICKSVMDYLMENAFLLDKNNKIEATNIIFVNQIGYSVLGFNSREKNVPPHIPSKEQKVVSLRNYSSFKTNKGKTQLINHLTNYMVENNKNNGFVVARQCKVNINNVEEELSGQWASRTYPMMQNECDLLKLDTSYIPSIKYVIDLGGGSGTFYKYDESTKTFNKMKEIRDFMKGDEVSPNSFVNENEQTYDIEGFKALFKTKFNEIYNEHLV